MTPNEFLTTLYFGDRYCTKIVIDSFNDSLEIHMNDICILDYGKNIGELNFDSSNSIENGIIKISQVSKVIFPDNGLMPNDQLYDIIVNKFEDDLYEFIIYASHGHQDIPKTTDIEIKVFGKEIELVNPNE